MNLKEAFRFQNKLKSMIEECYSILLDQGETTTTTTTTFLSKVDPDVKDEVTELQHTTDYASDITKVASIMLYLIEERGKLFAAIRDAKRYIDVDIDSESGLNQSRQSAASILKKLSNMKSREVEHKGLGTGYRFNAEGNQVTYRCDSKVVTTINYDRTKIRKMFADISKKADEVSAEIDYAIVNTIVDYEQPFDVNSDLSDLFENFGAEE